MIDPKYIYIQVGIIISLVSVCLGLLIEQAVHHDEASVELDNRLQVLDNQLRTCANETIDAINQIHRIASASQECRDLVVQIVRTWTQLDECKNKAVFSSIRHTKTQELSKLLGELANGSITVSLDGPFSVRARQFDGIKEYRAISVGPLEFWTTNFGVNYLEAQRKAIQENSIEVERIFVLDDNQIAFAESVVRAQVTAGVQVWVLSRGSVPDWHLKHMVDQGILTFENDDRMLMQPLARGHQMRADRERLSIDPEDISAAEFSLKVLRQYATKLEEATRWPW